MSEKKPKKNNLDEKWGESALSMGWTAIPASLFFLQNTLSISPVAFNVLLNLITHWWKADEWPHPSQQSVAGRMGVSTRTVQRGLDELEEFGILIKIKTAREDKKYRGRNIYDLSGLVKKLNLLTPELNEKMSPPDLT